MSLSVEQDLVKEMRKVYKENSTLSLRIRSVFGNESSPKPLSEVIENLKQHQGKGGASDFTLNKFSVQITRFETSVKGSSTVTPLSRPHPRKFLGD